MVINSSISNACPVGILLVILHRHASFAFLNVAGACTAITKEDRSHLERQAVRASSRLFVKERSETGSNGGPGEVSLVGRAAACCKLVAVTVIGQDADQRGVQLIRLVRRDKDDTCVRHGQRSLGTGVSDYG